MMNIDIEKLAEEEGKKIVDAIASKYRDAKFDNKNNSFTEFLLYTTPNGKVKVEIFLCDENTWFTQKRIVSILDKFDALVNDISVGLPAELTARRKQMNIIAGNF